jgi:predicted adenine nucleotide alpha hydrolase (AANH) superfamily ATPase
VCMHAYVSTGTHTLRGREAHKDRKEEGQRAGTCPMLSLVMVAKRARRMGVPSFTGTTARGTQSQASAICRAGCALMSLSVAKRGKGTTR